LSLILPTLNEEAEIGPTLQAITAARNAAGRPTELIIVDGGSRDGTLARLAGRTDLILLSGPQGRALQMNLGARRARAEWLLFLHADSRPAREAFRVLTQRLSPGGRTLYAFTLRIREPRPIFRRLERAVAWRSRRLGLTYGDQGLCVHRSLWETLGGFRPEALAEDLDFVLRARPRARVELLPATIETSARQWRRQGLLAATAFNLARLAAALTVKLLSPDGGWPLLLSLARGREGRAEEADAGS